MAASRPPKTPFPYPYKSGQHEVTRADARRLRKRAVAALGNDGIGRPSAYHREIFDQILADPRCVGIRFYPGIDDKGEVTMLYVGIDAKGNNLTSLIGDLPFRCPPFCAATRDGVLDL